MKKKSLFLTAIASLGLTAASVAQNVPNYLPTNGLQGWYPFTNNANDHSTNANNGTSNGAVLTTDRFGNPNSAYSFDGVNDYISASQNLNDYSISLWFYSSNLTNQYNDIFHYENTYAQLLNNATIYARAQYASPPSIGVVTTYTNNLNQWHHLVVNYNSVSQQMDVYIDETNHFTSGSGSGGIYYPSENNNTIYFGGYFLQNVNYFNGKIDDIGVWNRSLTQQEITDLYNATNCSNNSTINPQINSLSTGSTATFNATTSDPSPSYVWQSDLGQGFQTLNNFGNYSGVNSATLNIANVQISEHNQPIRVITASGNCIDTSNIAIINIADTCIATITDTTFITVTDTLIINTTITSLNPPSNSNTIKVFPNPTNDHITIDYGNFNVMNGYQLKIENSLGQQVFQTSITQQSDYLNLTAWGGNGLYFVHIIDPQGNTIDIRKIVLQ